MTTDAPPPPEPKPLPAKRRGRPKRLEQDPTLTEDICGLLSQGDPIETVCEMVGIAESTFHEWVRKGDADLDEGRQTLESDFSESVKRARAEYVHGAFQTVRRGGEGWQGEAWGLERTKRHLFARPAQVEVSGPGGRPIQVEARDLREMSTEDLERIVAGDAAAATGGG